MVIDIKIIWKRYMQKKINRDFFITVLTVILPVSMQFFYIRYISYNVDKEIFGNFVLLQTLIAALSYIFIQIPSQAYDRFYNTSKDKVLFLNEFRTILIFVNILSFLCILLYGYLYEKYYFVSLFLLFVLFVLLNNYSFNQKVFLLNLERTKYFYLKLLESTAKFITPLIAYYFYQTLDSFLFGLTIGYLIAFIILMSYMKEYKFQIVVRLDNLKKYFKFAYPILFVSIFTWGISFSDRYFIDFYLTTKDVALYAILAQVAGIGQIVGQIFYLYVNPKVLKMFEENEANALQYLSKMLKYLALVFVLLSIIALVLPNAIYELLIEPSVIGNTYYFYTFMLLIVGIFFTVYQTAYSMYLNLFKKLNILSYIYLAAFLINLVGNFFIDDYGIIAAAISTLVAYFLILLLQIIYIKKLKYSKIYEC